MTTATAFKGKAPKKSDGGDFHVPPAGSHPAILVAMIDLGTQKESYQGEEREVRQVFLVWELTAEQMPGSTFNHVLGKVYTLSFHEKAGLRKLAEKWRGKAYNAEDEIDYGAMVGKPCLLTVEHKQSKDGERTYANLAGVSPVPKGLAVPPAKRPQTAWEIAGGSLERLPDWLPRIYGEPVADVVRRAPELSGARQADSGPEESQEETPF